LELGALGKLITSNTDITDPAQLDILLAQIDSKFGDLDLLVNSAGVFLPKPFLEHTLEDYDRYLNLNRGTFFITQRVARNMVKRGRGGAIVNIGSMWAKQSVQATPSSAYSMAKAGQCFVDIFFDFILRLQTKHFSHHFAVATNVKRWKVGTARRRKRYLRSPRRLELDNSRRARWQTFQYRRD
jgi:NADP-dependent 3-hydroxy acid dehydrogenase YdfG